MLNSIYSLILLLLVAPLSNEAIVQEDNYIVFMNNHPPKEESTLRQMHMDVLSFVKGSENDAKESLVYSYTKSFNGFAAKLSQNEANKLSEMDQVLNVIKSRKRKIHTTRSWDFLGFPPTAKRKLKFESDVIVGLLDTGITPDSKSFADDGLGPIPKIWKGSCGPYANFSGCNKKLIGARYYKEDEDEISGQGKLSPLDLEGHGTHTSSTAVGALVNDANLFGLGKGTSRGAAPSARVAMYKVCWEGGWCDLTSITKAIDDAIHDGVNILSLSLGGDSPKYDEDPMAIALFHAMINGILPVLSAGNEKFEGSVVNHAPWMLTVAASTIDRQFMSTLELGNGLKFTGINLNLFNTTSKAPITIGHDDAAKKNFSSIEDEEARYCSQFLDSKTVKGKIVLCKPKFYGHDADRIRKLGGVGIVAPLDDMEISEAVYPSSIPLTIVNTTSLTTIIHYITSTKSPTGIIHKSEQVKYPAPITASFSSRGPHPLSHNLLKPDITAPGVNILASFTPFTSIVDSTEYPLYSNFNILSGTSMSCPHVSGVAAYVKSFHPSWSISAIKSAIMTTATPMSRKRNSGAEFGFGVGQVNPTRAVNPGLIYDMNELSYIQYLCHEGYSDKAMRTIVGDKTFKCSSIKQGRGSDAINYPTMQLHVKKGQKMPTTSVFYRTVTNVGPAESVYDAIVRAPKGVEISVEPSNLSFTRESEKKEFKVVVRVNDKSTREDLVSGSLTWKNSKYSVTSPIVVSFFKIPL